METLRNFAAIEAAIHRMAHELRKVGRWEHYEEDTKQREDDLEHAFKGAMLAQVMIALERAARASEWSGQRRDFDAYRILAAAVVHDIGEGAVGDVRYEIKQDSRIRAVLKEHERNGFLRYIASFPREAQKEITRAYDLQDDRESLEGRFFNALERLGYMFWAVREFLDGSRVYIEVFQNQHEQLRAYMDEFACVRILYGPLVPEIERILAESADMERTVPVPKDDAEREKR